MAGLLALHRTRRNTARDKRLAVDDADPNATSTANPAFNDESHVGAVSPGQGDGPWPSTQDLLQAHVVLNPFGAGPGRSRNHPAHRAVQGHDNPMYAVPSKVGGTIVISSLQTAGLVPSDTSTDYQDSDMPDYGVFNDVDSTRYLNPSVPVAAPVLYATTGLDYQAAENVAPEYAAVDYFGPFGEATYEDVTSETFHKGTLERKMQVGHDGSLRMASVRRKNPLLQVAPEEGAGHDYEYSPAVAAAAAAAAAPGFDADSDSNIGSGVGSDVDEGKQDGAGGHEYAEAVDAVDESGVYTVVDADDTSQPVCAEIRDPGAPGEYDRVSPQATVNMAETSFSGDRVAPTGSGLQVNLASGDKVFTIPIEGEDGYLDVDATCSDDEAPPLPVKEAPSTSLPIDPTDQDYDGGTF